MTIVELKGKLTTIEFVKDSYEDGSLGIDCYALNESTDLWNPICKVTTSIKTDKSIDKNERINFIDIMDCESEILTWLMKNRYIRLSGNTRIRKENTMYPLVEFAEDFVNDICVTKRDFLKDK